MIEKIKLPIGGRQLIYKGAFDLEDKVLFDFQIEEKTIQFNLKEYMEKGYLHDISAFYFWNFCQKNNIKATFYSNGNISLTLRNDESKEIEPCFILRNNDIFCLISVNEIQPCLYEIWLEGIFRCANASTNR